MECYYHPDRNASDICAICGKSVCKECCLEIAGKTYCKECLEKIVGVGLDDNTKAEPVRLEKQSENIDEIFAKESESSYQPISDDSPYNIRDSINYEAESYTQDAYQPPEVQQSLHQAIEEINEKPQNEFDDIVRQPVRDDDYIYPDHSYNPPQTSASSALEDKYERYLDDLYFDEEVPLDQQLAKDEEKYGSLTRSPRPVRREVSYEEDDLDRRIREQLAREQSRKSGRPIHNINYSDEKEPYGAVDIVLTVILVIVILVVLYYIVYLFLLSSTYPTFSDAIFALSNPGNVINALLS